MLLADLQYLQRQLKPVSVCTSLFQGGFTTVWFSQAYSNGYWYAFYIEKEHISKPTGRSSRGRRAAVRAYIGVAMSYRGYPSTSGSVRERLEKLAMLPDSAPEWLSFSRDEMRLPGWVLPALRAAVRQRGWRTAVDPVALLPATVHRLAIEMRLSNYDQAFNPMLAPEED